MNSHVLTLPIGFLLSAGWVASEATAGDVSRGPGACDSRVACSSGVLAGEPLVAAQTALPVSMPDLLGAQIFYDNGFLGDSVVLAIVDRGWVDTRVFGLNAPGRVTEFLSWVGSPDPGLRVRTNHETLVAAAAAADRPDYRKGIAPGAELWSAGVFTHRSFPWITSPNPPFYGLMVFGRFGVGGRTAHVLNNSWNWNHDQHWGFSGDTHVTYAADAIALDGRIVVVAANNWTRPPEPPGDGWNVITVGATTPPGSYHAVAGFSNRGPSPSFFCPCDVAWLKRSTVDIVAPGEGTPWGSGTSLAAPLVSGGATLLVDKGLSRGYSIDPRVIKAVLLNSARPLAGWTNGATHVESVRLTDQPLDYAQGAGQLSLDDAYRQYDAPAQAGDVEIVGWDLGTVAAGVPRDYRLRLPLQGGRSFVATLVWFMDRDVVGYDPDATDPFGSSTLEDRSFDNLDLMLELEREGGTELVAASRSLVDSVEHIRFDIPKTGTYTLRVQWTGEVFDHIAAADDEVFAVAWKGVAAEFCAPDIEPPLLTCPADIAVECGTDTTPAVTGVPDPTDNCAIRSTTFHDTSSAGCGGTTMIDRAWVATDDSGNAAECSQRVSIVDSTVPELRCAASRTKLWPPNSEMVDVGLTFSARDGCDGGTLATSIAVSSDERSARERGAATGRRCPDAVVESDGTVRLRAERSGAGDGRVYRIAVTATDACGNTGVCTVPVTVPHSARSSGAALDSGRDFDPRTCDGLDAS